MSALFVVIKQYDKEHFHIMYEIQQCNQFYINGII